MKLPRKKKKQAKKAIQQICRAVVAIQCMAIAADKASKSINAMINALNRPYYINNPITRTDRLIEHLN